MSHDDVKLRARRAVEALIAATKHVRTAPAAAEVSKSAAALAPASASATFASARLLSRLIVATRENPKFMERYTHPLAGFEALRVDAEDDAPDAVFGLDCEMVETADDPMALARVSLVRASTPLSPTCAFTTLVDLIVMPVSRADFILDTRQDITGLTRDVIAARGVAPRVARDAVRAALCGCKANVVLVGHALEHDLLALELNWDRVVDTSLLTAVEGNDDAVRDATHSLAHLAHAVLGQGSDGRMERGGKHDSVEDATLAVRIAAAFCERASSISFPLVLPRNVTRAKRMAVVERGDAGRLRAQQIELSDSRAKMAMDLALALPVRGLQSTT